MAVKEVTTQTGLRVPESLRLRLLAEAEAAGWSINVEMLKRLEASFATEARVQELQARIRAQESQIHDLEGMTRDLTRVLVAERFESHAQIQEARAEMPDDRPPDEEWPDAETQRRALEPDRVSRRGRGSK